MKEIFQKTKQIFLFLLLLNLSVLALKGAEGDKERSNKKKYSSSTSFSCVLTRGNSKAFSFSFDTEQSFRIQKNKLSLKGSVIYSNSNNKERSEIYYCHLKYDRQMSSRAYLLSLLRAERNKLAGYKLRFAFFAGAGYTWIQREKMEISSEGSFGWSREDNLRKDILKDRVDEGLSIAEKSFFSSFLSFQFLNKLVYNFSSGAQFVHHEIFFMNVESFKGYRINSYSAISASINRYFALKTSIQVIYDNNPVPGYKNTDFFLLSSIVIKI